MSTETGGVTLSIEERIKQDAIQIAKDELDNSKPYPSWEYLIEKGALSERNKTIEEVKLLLEQSRDNAISERAGTTPSGHAFLILKGHEYEAVKMIKLLESLKV